MTKVIFIHCFSCGQDCTSSEARQKVGKPIRRCGKCRSLNFRVISMSEFVDDVYQFEDAKKIMKVLEAECTNDQQFNS
jgi:hypothetical protein